jgi:hypothetical protein
MLVLLRITAGYFGLHSALIGIHKPPPPGYKCIIELKTSVVFYFFKAAVIMIFSLYGQIKEAHTIP